VWGVLNTRSDVSPPVNPNKKDSNISLTPNESQLLDDFLIRSVSKDRDAHHVAVASAAFTNRCSKPNVRLSEDMFTEFPSDGCQHLAEGRKKKKAELQSH